MRKRSGKAWHESIGILSPTESRSRPCSTGSSADITGTARHPPTSGRLRNSPSKSAKRRSVTGCSSRPRSSNGRGDKGGDAKGRSRVHGGRPCPGHQGSLAITARQIGRGLRPGLPPRPPVRPVRRRLRPAQGDGLRTRFPDPTPTDLRSSVIAGRPAGGPIGGAGRTRAVVDVCDARGFPLFSSSGTGYYNSERRELASCW